jgi:hypothetical protein
MKTRAMVALAMILALMAALVPAPLAADDVPVINFVQLAPAVEAINVAPCAGLTSVTVQTNVTGGTEPNSVKLLWRNPDGVWGGRNMLPAGGDDWQAPLGPFTEKGVYFYYVSVRDAASETAVSDPKSIRVVDCDTQAPPIENVTVAPAQGDLYKMGCQPGPTTLTVRAGVSDPAGLANTEPRLYYRVGAGDWQYVVMTNLWFDAFSATLGPFTETGALSFYVEATDTLGNQGMSDTMTREILACDTEPPVISDVRQSLRSIWEIRCGGPNMAMVSANVTDDTQVAEVRIFFQFVPSQPGKVAVNAPNWSSKLMTPLHGAWVYQGLQNNLAGTIFFYIFAKDVAQNKSTTQMYTVQVNACEKTSGGSGS